MNWFGISYKKGLLVDLAGKKARLAALNEVLDSLQIFPSDYLDEKFSLVENIARLEEMIEKAP